MKCSFRSRSNRTRSGFVLIEVLFAVGLILTGALIVAATMPIANVSRNKAQLADKAMDVAQKQIEAIRAAGFSNGTASGLSTINLIDSANPISGTSDLYSFTNSDSTVLDNPATVLPNGQGTVQIDSLSLTMTRIIVTVTYTDNSKQASFTVGSLEANL